MFNKIFLSSNQEIFYILLSGSALINGQRVDLLLTFFFKQETGLTLALNLGPKP